MAWSGGNFSRTDGTRTGGTVWTQAKAASVKILSVDHDTHDQDLATGINQCWNRDGSNTPSANLGMNTKKFTALAAGTSAGDSLRYEQFFPFITDDLTLQDTNADALAGPELILDLQLVRRVH